MPEGWSWTVGGKNQSWAPVWNTLPLASRACSELEKGVWLWRSLRSPPEIAATRETDDVLYSRSLPPTLTLAQELDPLGYMWS